MGEPVGSRINAILEDLLQVGQAMRRLDTRARTIARAKLPAAQKLALLREQHAAATLQRQRHDELWATLERLVERS